MKHKLDDRDRLILRERMAAHEAGDGPQVGDFVTFAGGTRRRLSRLWPDGFQTSDVGSGSYYLGPGYVSYSGGLYTACPIDSLTYANSHAIGMVWFFHHDDHRAHNGVEAVGSFRMWDCGLEAPTA